ncbi:hypothetical protein DENIS_2527 [Desulfonema ishimotonii]|uniref:Methyltransferase domain-containing protein n=1 Tax=Desulfonema ishimotonii TaxID=45657 RepID=A0A401FX71_9BACT|nr:class I SAM-dependent methyltransferase [Desulfonema ishimotonii]GBC61565.1 hypothetical protein DENIS_2527 [Desulfonema ishimotonii]
MDISSPSFWENTWRETASDFFLKKTQKTNPERWTEFFNRVSDIYPEMWGHPRILGDTVADLFFSEKLIASGSRVLDMGCGPGTLAIPLAERGAQVLAADQAEEMLTTLEQAASARNLKNVATRRTSFQEYDAAATHDLAVAAFFPPAFSPEGICRLESMSRKYCALVLGTGQETFPFRRQLWKEIMDVPLQSGRFHLTYLTGYLLAADRQPNLKHLSWPVRFSSPLEDQVRFFKSYFAIFGHNDSATETAIRRLLGQYVVKDRVETEGRADIAVVWWER